MSVPSVEVAGRFHRQVLLPQIGEVGQLRLAAAHAMIVGCGALGSACAEMLVRAGVGALTLIDRDVVEWTNLQRQSLYDEGDAREALPKAEAARKRLAEIDSGIDLRAVVADCSHRNAEALFAEAVPASSVIIDGTDNFETRYLINDFAVSKGLSWIYGGAVGTIGRVMTIVPGVTPCLRCLFEEPPMPGSEAATQTCEVVGVLGPVTAIIGAMQAAAAMRVIVGGPASAPARLFSIDAWEGEARSIDVAGARRADCPCCGERRFPFLRGERGSSAVSLCGRNAVQVSPEGLARIDLAGLAERLRRVGEFEVTRFLVRGRLRSEPDAMGNPLSLTVFADGRAQIFGTTDLGQARGVYSKYVGL